MISLSLCLFALLPPLQTPGQQGADSATEVGTGGWSQNEFYRYNPPTPCSATAPPYRGPRGFQTVPAPAPVQPATGVGERPGDTSQPSSPSTPGGAQQPAAPSTPSSTAPATGPAVSGTPGRKPSRPNNPSTLGVTDTVGPESWWTWWNLHKLEYLEPNLIRNWVSTLTGMSQGSSGPPRMLGILRDELEDEIYASMRNGSPALRASAVVAASRLYGNEAVDELVDMLDDVSIPVRERALLALGVSRSPSANRVLYSVAKHGSLEPRGERISADARHLAVVALAMSRQIGSPAEIDTALGLVSRDIERSERTRLESALCSYAAVTDTQHLEALVDERTFDGRASMFVRCRAIEALSGRQDDEAREALARGLRESNPEVRRSAALAAGDFPDARMTLTLLEAAQREREPLARGFMMISLGRRGGEAARRFLVREIQEGQKFLRAWAALGLGILAGEANDDEAREALRTGASTERNQSHKGAWFLALGLAGDEKAEALLRTALVTESMPRTRVAAGFGLALLRTPGAHDALVAHLDRDSAPFVRSQIAQCVGFFGESRDAEAVIASFEGANPAFAGHHALALGVHGTRQSLEALVRMYRDEERSILHRALALESLQLLLGEGQGFHLSPIMRQTNFAMFQPPLARHRFALL